ncbi:MAG: 16S rRNA (adenine(1518)-N(6)/adenine(1519)-N(6))-dimethyltransferase RsmA [Desulfurococcaceae archaeon]|nr:16S rRNA (adenine(1518)-N(6)/adenine(1519)-N(6))-dimethyltransferase RsmA [Sulfolobales archaeon]MDW8170361.1 16S rRNA (adenine(1518)-N(6)/adenine(1519)-N(6))-dimethyltransferase RsmA [Desulfurococcaceae archaeon]
MLKVYNLKPKESMGQSFLINPRVARDFIAELKMHRVKPGELICEVGSGLGVITYALLREEYRVLAIELDERLAELTNQVATGYPGAIVVNADALDLKYLCRVVVSNAPYYLSSDLLIKVARESSVELALIVLQKEVVDRVCAKPSTKEYGRLSIIIQLLFNTKPGAFYSSSDFYPKPKVTSRMLVLERKNPYNSIYRRVEELTRVLFNERRKKALKVIEKNLGLRKDDVELLGVSSGARVYQLPPQVFVELAKLVELHEAPASSK